MVRNPDEKAVYDTCPRCGDDTLRIDRPALNALSRVDNKTYVCSDCGTSEAWERFVNPGETLSKDYWVHPETR